MYNKQNFKFKIVFERIS